MLMGVGGNMHTQRAYMNTSTVTYQKKEKSVNAK